MLVLARRVGEKVCFPDLNVTLEVLRSNSSAVRLGISAPRSVRIVREELLGQGGPADATSGCAEPGASAAVPEGKRQDAEPVQQDGDTNPLKTLTSADRHALQNRLHALRLGLHVLRQDPGAMDSPLWAQLDEYVEALSEGRWREANPESGSDESEPVPATVLLVEDDPFERATMGQLLRNNGFEVVTARDGLEAIHYLDNHQMPTFILMDMKMPRCDGATTVRYIRDGLRFAGVKLFAVSGSSPQECGVEISDRGVDGWFAKPVNPAQLLDSLGVSQVA